jgi:hypothetical protein
MQICCPGGSSTPIGWPLTWWACQVEGSANSLALAPTINKVTLLGFVLPVAVTFNKLSIAVQVADATGLYDWGLYDSTGALICHVGAQTIPATGVNTQTVTGAPISLNPGKYYLGLTANATLAKISVGNPTGGAWSFLYNINVATSSGGALPASLTPPADSIVTILAPTFALSS